MDIERNPGPSHELNLFHWNARSLRNKLDYLEDISSDSHIICITETHLDINISSKDIQLSGFMEPFRKDRTFAGGGVLIYISNLLKGKRRLDLEVPDLESVWVELCLPSSKFLICCVYRPPNSNEYFWERFQQSIEKAYDESQQILIAGDLNTDLLEVSYRHSLPRLLTQYNLINVISEPTRISNTRNSLLDVILMNSDLNCISSSVLDIERVMSDHNACTASFGISVRLSNSFKRTVWLYKHADFDKFNDSLTAIDWNSLFRTAENIDEACEIFTATFLSIAKSCIPSKLVTIRPNDKPWMTSELRHEIRIRDKLHRKAKQTTRPSDFNNFKRQRNKVNNMKKHCRTSFYEDINGIIDTLNISDPKSYWKLVKQLINSSGSSCAIPPLCDSDTDRIVMDNGEKAHLLNRYFCSISSIDDTSKQLPEFPDRTEESLENLEVTSDEVYDIIKILKLGKACGADSISHNMLKGTAQTVCKPLSLLFNMSLISQKYPQQWKQAVILPLFKKGDQHNLTNYRPISLLSCVGKIFERVVYKHVHNFLLSNSLFYNMQSGFMPKHSTVHQLIEIHFSMCQSLENKEHMCMIFCDMSKAFDRVWHRGLFKKLSAYGIKGQLLNWIKDYMTNRQQCVLVNNEKSCNGVISAGVPQGSVLGPLFFLIYINDIADSLISCSRLFADDTSLSYSSTCINDLERIINSDLEKLKVWSCKWLTTFNPSKTEALFISNSKETLRPLDLIFDNTALEISSFHKHLGVTLHENAKWSIHIQNIYSSSMKRVNAMRKLKYLLNRKTLLKIYKCFILPILEYACEVWDGCTAQECDILESVQLEAARIITGLPRFCKKEYLYTETGLETLAQRRQNRKLSLFYKMHKNLTPTYLTNLLPSQVNDRAPYPLRHGDDYTIPNNRLSITNNSFLPSTIRIWNSLNTQVRNCETLSKFNAAVRPATNKVPQYFFCGVRKLSILHSRLRCYCSTLNYDLFRVNLKDDPSCTCGSPCENAFHFFFECPLYHRQRLILLNSLSTFEHIHLGLLLNGDSTLPFENNIYICQKVQHYINTSGRF